MIEDKNTTVLNLRTMNDAFDGQFINEANITGRVCKDAKAAEKSSSVNVAVNRYSVVNGASKESTDYFRVVATGKLKDRFEKLSKGSLIELSGMVVTMRNREGAEYIELKARFMQVHSKSKAVAVVETPHPNQMPWEWMTPISLATTCPSPDTNGILSRRLPLRGFRQEQQHPVERHLLEAQQARGRQQSRDPHAWR